MYELHPDRTIIFVDANALADQILGFDNQAQVGKELEEVFPDGKYTEIQRIIRKVALSGQSLWSEQIPYYKHEAAEALELLVIAYGNWILVFFKSETENRETDLFATKRINELEHMLRENTVQLELMKKELDSFAYSVSHDLRSPLRGIDGWSMALLEDYGDTFDDEASRFLGKIRSESQRMSQQIEALLKLSRICRKSLTPVMIDVSNMAEEILNRLQEEYPERKVQIIIEPGVIIYGDADLLGIVMNNLLENAWKFSGLKDIANIEVGSTIKDGKTVYYVRDNGTGFNLESSTKLFGAFQRMHKASDFPGMGVGLATAHRIILRHGGNMWAETQITKGATFFWTIGSNINEE